MKPTWLISFFLLIPTSKCLGNDLQNPTILDRLDALEKKDNEKSATIHLLKQEAKTNKQNLRHLTETNKNLHNQLSETINKLEKQESIIASLQKEIALQTSYAEDCKLKADFLESRVLKMSSNMEKMTENVAALKAHIKKQLDMVNMKPVSIVRGQTDAKENADEDNDSAYLVGDDSNLVDDVLLKTSKERDDGHSKLQRNTRDTFGKVSKSKAYGIGNQQINRRLEQRNTGQQNHSRFIETTSTVAFHAVLSPLVISHLGTNDNIKFDTILLNEGNSYHNHQGLFIAPKSGFYLFSVTIASNSGQKFAATVLKNGARLASLTGKGEQGGFHEQGSVTMVTKLTTGDEVWVVHVSPPDGSISGSSYTSFTGFLIMEYE